MNSFTRYCSRSLISMTRLKSVLGIAPPLLDLALDDLVVGRVDVVVQGGGDLRTLKGVRKPSLMPSFSE
jgi:hypothetical protein